MFIPDNVFRRRQIDRGAIKIIGKDVSNEDFHLGKTVITEDAIRYSHVEKCTFYFHSKRVNFGNVIFRNCVFHAKKLICDWNLHDCAFHNCKFIGNFRMSAWGYNTDSDVSVQGIFDKCDFSLTNFQHISLHNCELASQIKPQKPHLWFANPFKNERYLDLGKIHKGLSMWVMCSYAGQSGCFFTPDYFLKVRHVPEPEFEEFIKQCRNTDGIWMNF